MENYGYLIDSYRRFGRALEDLVTKDLVDFVSKNGKPEGDKVLFDFNKSETYMVLPSLSVPIYDCSQRDNLFEPLETLSVERAGKDLVRLCYSTASYTDTSAYIDLLTLLNIHSVLRAIETGEYPDLRIEDGKIVVKK